MVWWGSEASPQLHISSLLFPPPLPSPFSFLLTLPVRFTLRYITNLLKVLLKGMVAPAIFMPTWAGAIFAVPAGAFVISEILKVGG